MKTKQTFYVILGVLCIKPMSAYDIKKFISDNVSFFWNESYGNIHKNLQELLKQKLIKVKSSTSEGREKIIYQITDDGKDWVNAWIREYPQETVLRHELLMKMFISSSEHISTIIHFIEQEKVQYQNAFVILMSIKEHVETIKTNQYRTEVSKLVLDFGMKYSQMVISWCEDSLRTLNNLDRETN